MVWYGLIECAVHVHRQVVTSRQLAATLLQCGAEKRKELPQHKLAPAADNYPCLRCKHAAFDVSHNAKNSSSDDRATRFTKSAMWHDCDRAALLLWHMFIAKNAPMLWYAATRRGTTCWSALAARHQRSPPGWQLTTPWTPLALLHDNQLQAGAHTGQTHSSRHHAALLRQRGNWAARNGPLVRHGQD